MPPPIIRNLTPAFARYRQARREAQQRAGALLAGGDPSQPAQRLLGDADSRQSRNGDVALEMASLPPAWVDSAEEAEEDLKNIQEKLVQLTKLQQRRLLNVFNDDGAPDKEVEAVSNQITALVRRCEKQIHQVKTRGAGTESASRDPEFRQNVQRSLATKLQKLSQQFRQTQKDYLNEIRKRQKDAGWDDPSNSHANGSTQDSGFNNEQLLELESMEMNASQRSEEICRIASSISELHTIFKELAVLVIDQGSILDRIDYNIEQVVHKSTEANVQLHKAEASQKSNRAMKCILLLVAINSFLILILIWKARH